METNSWSKTELLQAIASYWGGVDNKLNIVRKSHATFVGDEGMSRYRIDFPGTGTTFKEDSGRPFPGRVPAGKLRVVCLDDAPDCWWYIDVDESMRKRLLVRN